MESQDIANLKQAQTTTSSGLTRQRTKLVKLMSDEENLSEVKDEFKVFNLKFEKYVDAHMQYIVEIYKEEEIDRENARYGERERSALEFISQVASWINWAEDRLLSQYDSVSQDGTSRASNCTPTSTYTKRRRQRTHSSSRVSSSHERQPSESYFPSRRQREAPTSPSHSQRTEFTTPSRRHRTEPTSPSHSQRTEPTSPSRRQRTEPMSPSRRQRTEPTSPSRSQRTEPTSPSRRQRTEPTSSSRRHRTESTSPSHRQPIEPTSPSRRQLTESTSPSRRHRTEFTSPSRRQRIEPTSPSRRQLTESTSLSRHRHRYPLSPRRHQFTDLASSMRERHPADLCEQLEDSGEFEFQQQYRPSPSRTPSIACSSSLAKVKADIAELLVEREMLMEKQRLKQREELLALQTEIHKAIAREKAIEQAESDPSKLQDPSYQVPLLSPPFAQKEKLNPTAKEFTTKYFSTYGINDHPSMDLGTTHIYSRDVPEKEHQEEVMSSYQQLAAAFTLP